MLATFQLSFDVHSGVLRSARACLSTPDFQVLCAHAGTAPE
ncbi:hypothetical protein [Pseudomonas sp. BN415]|nr:hypothetical protein [Pseudomonas sp. BN415]